MVHAKDKTTLAETGHGMFLICKYKIFAIFPGSRQSTLVFVLK